MKFPKSITLLILLFLTVDLIAQISDDGILVAPPPLPHLQMEGVKAKPKFLVDNIYVFEKSENGKSLLGCINVKGEVIVEGIFVSIVLSKNEQHILTSDGKNAIVFDKNGAIVFEQKSSRISNINFGYYLLREELDLYSSGKKVLLDESFNRILEAGHSFIEPLSKEFFILRAENGAKKMVNLKGENILETSYKNIIFVNENLIFVQGFAPLYAIYNATGKQIQPPSFLTVKRSKRNPNYIILQEPYSGKYGLMDVDGAQSEFLYDEYDRTTTRHHKVFMRKDKSIVSIGENLQEIPLTKQDSNSVFRGKDKAYQSWRFEPIVMNQKAIGSITENMEGKYLKYTAINGMDCMVEYEFLKEGGGTQTIYLNVGKGLDEKIIQNFSSRLTYDSYVYVWLTYDVENVEYILSKKNEKAVKNAEILRKNESFFVLTNYPYDKVSLSRLEKQEKGKGIENKDKSVLQQYVKVKNAEAALNRTLTLLPKRSSDFLPYFTIDTNDNTVYMHNNNKTTKMGGITFEKGNWYFGYDRFFSKELVLPLYLMKGVRYRKNKEEEVKTGNLMIGYDANSFDFRMSES